MHVEALSPLQRVLIIAGAAVLLPVIAVLALLLRNEFADRQAAVEQSALENAHVLIELADALLRGDLQTMRVLATSVPLVTGDLATARDRAAVVLDANPGWTSIALSDAATGRVKFEVGRAGPGAAAQGAWRGGVSACDFTGSAAISLASFTAFSGIPFSASRSPL